MTTTVLSAPAATRAVPSPLSVVRELLVRQRTLTVYAAVLLLLVVPAAVAWGVDDRVLRGANIWVKPIKFLLSVALLALTTAWFVGFLPEPQRRSRAVRVIVALLIGAGSFELAYIGLQAALGEGSHYNVRTPLLAVVYALMGIGALVLTATQPLLAWQIYRHPDAQRPQALRHAVLLGLTLTFVLGAGVGMLLSGVQPPDNSALPLFGWSMNGDLRPAHFIGIHAEQVLPVVGAGLALTMPRRATAAVWIVAGLYTAACVALAMHAFATRLA
jgi:hypothetical protein